jgi:hypothetical protein
MYIHTAYDKEDSELLRYIMLHRADNLMMTVVVFFEEPNILWDTKI